MLKPALLILLAMVLLPALEPATASPPAARTKSSNLGTMQALNGYAREKGLTVQSIGTSPFRIILVGTPKPAEADRMLALGEQTLAGFDVWTGKNAAFAAKGQPAGEDYLLCILPSKQGYDAFVDFLNKGTKKSTDGEPDLSKKVSGFSMPRALVTYAEPVSQIPQNYAIYTAACLAIDAFYAERPAKKAPPWIREGMAAEMQRLQVKSIRCTTIAYELNKEAAVEDWPGYVADLIAKGDRKTLCTSSDIFNQELAAMPGATYRQIWSFTTYVRGRCGAATGKQNKFLQILEATANGTVGHMAVKEVLNLKDPQLTNGWLQWAAENRKMR